MKKLTTVLILSALILSITACGGKKDAITTVKKGHFTEAPKITVEEIVKRYKHIKPDTITWESEKDANNNEYVVSTSHFESEDIILAGMREKLYSGAIDTSVISHYWDEFFWMFFASMNSGDHKIFDLRSEGYILPYDIMIGYDNFDHDNHMKVFYDCKGGDLIIDFVVSDDGTVDVKGGKLIFNMVSPVDGKDEEYECIYNLNKNMIKEKLLSNSDFEIDSLLIR